MASRPIAAAADIRAHAASLGLDAFGIASAEPGPHDAARLRAFLAAGHHGTMAWLANREAERASPLALWPGARSVVGVGNQSYRIAAESDLRPLIAEAVIGAGGALFRLSVVEPSLDDIYTRYFKSQAANANRAA